ncbi:neuregulin 2a isoform X5 [Pangasianodon hypophthalmus]|uniref:neuregulin 2a isoform X5 n=1 Tax=Pangasianodon hypophthalmus TaxID=310915 RepID=UPI002307841A|nr:neuregulin 2a isoform X5 [Pangasianodon hypophthalmus]
MDPHVSLYPLPMFLVSLCEGQRVAVVPGIGVGASSGAEAQRSLGLQGYPLSHIAHQRWQRCGCRRPCQGRAVLLIPTVLLLLLGLGTYLLLLNHVLIPSGNPDHPDLLRSEDEDIEEEGERTGNTAPSWMLITPTGTTDTPPTTFSIQETVAVSMLAPGTTLASSSPTPSSTPPPLALPPGSGHERRCNETEKGYCVNNGECYFIHGINQLSCKCPNDFTGDRCQTYVMASFYQSLGIEFMEAEELYQKRVLTITGICVTLLVVGIVCVVAYCKTNLPPRKQRKKMHNHLRQNMCLDHPNRSLANGPNHPGPGPEEIPMVDYISKNVPATERVMRSGAEASFAGSHHSSRSHNSSTRGHSSTHRHDEKTWSLERTDSVLSDCPSGVLSSSVGTSKCSSPACMEARARRATHCGFPESRRPPMRYGDSFDSLDSPHSDRYVSALTTPARLSPVDFHYSLPPQVPTFQITSPNASHAMSLPPAARAPYPPEEDQPLLRCYQLPLHEAQRYEPYQQRIQQQRARSYLQDSAGSLPSSPYRLAQDDDEYESTQEYPPSLEQPKRSSGRWHRSRLNGHVAPQGYRPPRDLGSRSCLSDSESEEGEEGESTPFLSMQNINTPEPSAIYRPAPPTHTRTSHTQSRHTQQQHARSKPDSAAH